MGILDEAEFQYQRRKEASERLAKRGNGSGVEQEEQGEKSNLQRSVDHCMELDIRFNDMSGGIEIYGVPWTDDACQGIRLDMHAAGIRASQADTYVAIERAAHRNSYDPLKDYLNGLEWDRVVRLPTVLTDALGAPNDPRTIAVGQRFFVSAVERALNPGCMHRMMLVLTGDEEVGKSRFVHDLAVRKEWHSDCLPHDLSVSREAMEAVMGRWILESAEMVSMRRSDHESIKAFISRREDTARMAYARAPTTYKRRCVLISTTNNESPVPYDGQWTRYVPIHVTEYQSDYFLGVRDQIWAESVSMYMAGYPTWLTPDMYMMLEEGREEFREEDSWEHIVIDGTIGRDEFGMADVFAPGWLDIPISQRNRAAESRVGRILKRLGFRRVRVRRGKALSWVYRIRGTGT